MVSPHSAQMMYFALVSAAALAPLHFSLTQVTTLFQSFRENKICSSLKVLVALSLGFTAVHLFRSDILCILQIMIANKCCHTHTHIYIYID